MVDFPLFALVLHMSQFYDVSYKEHDGNAQEMLCHYAILMDF
jgi:hypothetical protein